MNTDAKTKWRQELKKTSLAILQMTDEKIKEAIALYELDPSEELAKHISEMKFHREEVSAAIKRFELFIANDAEARNK